MKLFLSFKRETWERIQSIFRSFEFETVLPGTLAKDDKATWLCLPVYSQLLRHHGWSRIDGFYLKDHEEKSLMNKTKTEL